jgi:hypothetical protein
MYLGRQHTYFSAACNPTSRLVAISMGVNHSQLVVCTGVRPLPAATGAGVDVADASRRAWCSCVQVHGSYDIIDADLHGGQHRVAVDGDGIGRSPAHCLSVCTSPPSCMTLVVPQVLWQLGRTVARYLYMPA